ncbi:MAG: class I SAM-dependent rRNA methyltransferase [Saprospiraceae bacterium]|nr:class I SAM-dependent rRNA methyltransferase [Saprospiraceae bacterium]
MKRMVLKPGKDAPLRRFHPWVFSGAVAFKEEGIADGDTVEVFSKEGNYLATGHYQDSNICVRLFSFQQTDAGPVFWEEKLQNALLYRKLTGITGNPATNCYRLVHAEGDGLPGLIIDMYGRTAVLQFHSIGMHRASPLIADALLKIFGDHLDAVYDKSAETLPDQYAQGMVNAYLFGEKNGQVVEENGHYFQVDWETGQKTGFFLDQRDNRHLVAAYAAGKSLLNAFCYSGGFSVYALKAGALRVDSVDASKKAMELTNNNIALNGFSESNHNSITDDVMHFLRQPGEGYDMVIIDPPAFAKNISKRHQAVQGYRRLNALAFQKVKPGGILFTFSCSQVVDKPLFYNTIVAAALEAGRPVRLMHDLGQPADHPVSLYHPESSYLKGLALYVE